MLTCLITYEIDPYRIEAFHEYARIWTRAIPRCGADLIGYFLPHEGSMTLAYGLYSLRSLAEYEKYRARLARDPEGRANYDFAAREKFIRRETRLFLRRVTADPGGPA